MVPDKTKNRKAGQGLTQIGKGNTNIIRPLPLKQRLQAGAKERIKVIAFKITAALQQIRTRQGRETGVIEVTETEFATGNTSSAVKDAAEVADRSLISGQGAIQRGTAELGQVRLRDVSARGSSRYHGQ